MDLPNLRWWGWGTLEQTYPLDERTDFWPELQRELDLPDEAVQQETPPVGIEAIALRPSRLDDPVLSSLHRLLGAGAVRLDAQARIEHAYGKSYRDLIRIRAGHVPDPPDAVVYPADQGQVVALLAWAADREIAVIPFGGGSSITGGVEPTPGEHLTLTLDLARLDRVLYMDPVSHVVRAQGGIIGPSLETHLNAHGFTLGHLPQSFEFSTLGGWIATRGVGCQSSGYGGIEQMTCSARLVTPVGIVEMKNHSAAATGGASLLHTVIGSSGTCGVVTEATLCIRPRAALQDVRGVLFGSLDAGAAACRTLAQSQELHPTLIHLCDAHETAANAMVSDRRHGLRRLGDSLLNGYRKPQSLDFDSAALLLLGFEGDPRFVTRQWDAALQVCGDYHGASLGRAAGQTWVRERYLRPYLRDLLIGHGVMYDTLEAATNWSNLTRLYDAMVSAMKGAITAAGGGPGYVMVHAANVSEQGAVLIATFLGRQALDRDPMVRQAQAQTVKQVTMDAVLAAGGTLRMSTSDTRRDSAGYGDHTLWPEDEVSPVGFKALHAVKKALDPSGIMNPVNLLTV